MSKQYRLGLTRTSLPSLVSEWTRRSLLRKFSPDMRKNDFWALRNVSFDLKRGESLALVGANGAGKTTILKLLANISKPTSGSININGKLSALIELGAGFHPDLTGRENIYLNGTILGLSRKWITDHLDEIVEFSEIEKFIDTPVKRYSSGMVVRLGFAVAASIDPEILLVDEVLAVGDASFQQKCMTRIRSLIKNGTSIIFVSHNIYLVQAVCNTALYLEHGQIKNYGVARDIIDEYERDLHQQRAAKFTRLDDGANEEIENLEITSVEILGAQNDEPIFFSNQPAHIGIHYNAYQKLDKVNVSVFIKRSDGLTCCMMRTKIDKYDLILDRGSGMVSLKLVPLQLISGTYFIEAWFLNDSDSMGIVPRAGRSDWFEVKGHALSYSDDSGVFEPNAHWDHQPHGTPSIAGE